METVVLNAVVTGVVALLLGIAAQFWRRPLWWGGLIPLVVLLGVGLKVIDPRWGLDSLMSDAPWRTAAVMTVWWILVRPGWFRTDRWPLVVLGAALLGDELLAAGLVFAEADPGRRARLVLAASGASLIGPLGGGAVLGLGWGGPEIAVLGGVLALIGLCGGGGAKTGEAAPVPWRDAGYAPVTGLVVVMVTWLLMLGGGLEFVAMGLELLPMRLPGMEHEIVLGGAVLLGGLMQEGVAAAAMDGVLARTLDVPTETYRAAMTAGLAVGGGLPLLVATGCRLRVGVPLWLVQVVIVLVWGWFRLG